MAGKFLMAALAVVALLVQSATAATYTVRDNLGWGVPSGGAADYANWASTITFRVDDILVFNFGTGAHDVATVTKVNFDSCNTNGPITLQTVGPATVTLNATGEYNFICTFGRHCINGQKLSINVTSTTPPPVPVTPSPPPAPATPSPPPAPATPSPPPAPATPSPPPAPITPSPPPAPSTPSPPPAPATPSPPPTPATPSPPPSPATPTPPPSPATPTPPPAPATPSPSTPTPPTNAIPPPPPSSAPRSLTVFGFVCTLLAFVMGLTL